jgi:hypothetical protein
MGLVRTTGAEVVDMSSIATVGGVRRLYRSGPPIEALCPIHFAGFIAKWVGSLHTIEGPDL